jgi:hypothetical protein
LQRSISDQQVGNLTYISGLTKAVNNSVYGDVDTVREVCVVIKTGTKLHKRIARVSASSSDKGNSVNRDSSGTVGKVSTSALALRYSRGAPAETKKVGCTPSHGAIENGKRVRTEEFAER